MVSLITSINNSLIFLFLDYNQRTLHTEVINLLARAWILKTGDMAGVGEGTEVSREVILQTARHKMISSNPGNAEKPLKCW